MSKNKPPLIIFHVITCSRITGATPLQIEAHDKEEAKHFAYREIRRNNLNRFIVKVYTQKEYEEYLATAFIRKPQKH
jgi:hypothetical protein